MKLYSCSDDGSCLLEDKFDCNDEGSDIQFIGCSLFSNGPILNCGTLFTNTFVYSCGTEHEVSKL